MVVDQSPSGTRLSGRGLTNNRPPLNWSAKTTHKNNETRFLKKVFFLIKIQKIWFDCGFGGRTFERWNIRCEIWEGSENWKTFTPLTRLFRQGGTWSISTRSGVDRASFYIETLVRLPLSMSYLGFGHLKTEQGRTICPECHFQRNSRIVYVKMDTLR